MTKLYATQKLLEHGPLTLREFLEITHWNYNTARSTLRNLMRDGKVTAEHIAPRLCIYRLP